MAWRWASASVIGTSHIRNGSRLQDAFAVLEIGQDAIFAVVSDGAGSAEFGRYGARIVCRFFSSRFLEWFRTNSDLPTDEELRNWVDNLREITSGIARRKETLPRQFAATLAAIVARPTDALTLHIGDSAIVGRRREEWDVLCWPKNGEYASSTYFFTDDPEPQLSIGRHPRDHDAFALFSDGVGDLALSHVERVAHPKFFGPMISPVDSTTDNGHLFALSGKLSAYLSSPSVCERTDDDKTLILISSR